jgi:hypothetical protein
MSWIIKWACLAAVLAMLVTPIFESKAQTRMGTPKRYSAYRAPHYVLPSGPLTDGAWHADGWRYRSTARGWDNTCVNVPGLPSPFACSAK